MADEIPVDTNEGHPEGTQFADLQDRLAKAEQQRDEVLRTLAEYENARKRAARDQETEKRFAHTKLIGDLLPALDSMDRAVDAAKNAGDAGGLLQGVQATQALLLDALKRHGVVPIDSAPGVPFDPNQHQAVSMVPSAEHPANSVVQVLQKGFMIHERVLRPAVVVVSSGPPG